MTDPYPDKDPWEAYELACVRITEIEARLKAAELDAHTKDAFYGEKFAAQEIKLKAAEEWKAEARELLKTGDPETVYRHGKFFINTEWIIRRDALLAQEGGDK